MRIALSAATLAKLWPYAPRALIEATAAASAHVFEKYAITTPARVNDFMAQISEETGGGTALEEDLRYSAKRLCQVWPSRFPTIDKANLVAGSPRLIADAVYGGRYGNRPGTDDGYDFRGRGFMQLTFRDNYDRIGKDTGLDLIAHPELVSAPEHALECAASFWKLAGCNRFADSDDFVGETRTVNGGLINLATRQAWRTKWKAEPAHYEPDATPSPAEPPASPPPPPREAPPKAPPPSIPTTPAVIVAGTTITIAAKTAHNTAGSALDTHVLIGIAIVAAVAIAAALFFSRKG